MFTVFWDAHKQNVLANPHEEALDYRGKEELPFYKKWPKAWHVQGGALICHNRTRGEAIEKKQKGSIADKDKTNIMEENIQKWFTCCSGIQMH